MKRSEVKPTVDLLVDGVMSARRLDTREVNVTDIRLALETAFVAGVRSNLKFTSDAQFAKLFKGEKC